MANLTLETDDTMAEDVSFFLDPFLSNDLLGVPSELQQLFEDSLSASGVSEPDSTPADGTVKDDHSYATTSASPSEHPGENEGVLLARTDPMSSWNSGTVPDARSWVDSLFGPLPETDDVVESNVPGMRDYEPNVEKSIGPCPSPDYISGASDIDVMSPDSTDPACLNSSSRSQKRKLSGTSSTVSDSGISPSEQQSRGSTSKNAIAARENRIKKKRYVECLERKNGELEAENRLLTEKGTAQDQRIKELRKQNAYLENIVHNACALSSLLGALPTSSGAGLRLSIAGKSSGERKRRRATSGGSQDEVIPEMSRGVCLHVDGQTASLEFCSKCAIMAKGGSPS